MGSRVFTKAQYGLESTRGTAVAATRVIALAPDDQRPVPMDRTWEPREYGNGRKSAQQAHVYGQKLVEDELAISSGYYQILPAIFNCLLDGSITPAEQTPSQSDYKWDVAPSFTAANTPKTLTLEVGDDTQAYEMEHLMFKSLKLSAPIPDGQSAAPVAISAPFFARQVTATTFTSSQAVHSGLEYMNAKLTRLYLDTAWAGIGVTEQASTLRGVEVEIMTGNHPKFFGSANRYFDTYGEDKIGALLTFDLEGNSTADAIFDLMQAGTTRAVRLDFNGSQIGTGVNYLCRFDVFGRFISVEPVSKHVNGNNIHRVVFASEPDSSGNELDIDVITNHSTV